MSVKEQLQRNRDFMKRSFIPIDFFEKNKTDAQKGLLPPPIEKPYDESTSTILDLPDFKKVRLCEPNLLNCILKRRSHRAFLDQPISIEELSFLLFCTQGIKEVIARGKLTKRTVPSGGALHSFETYLTINNVRDLKKGVYRYLPLQHRLLFLFDDQDLMKNMVELCYKQIWIEESAVVFVWSTTPAKHEWGYSIEAYKDILQETGHICQNLYLACESIECGTCAIGAYDQTATDLYFNLDGNDEFVVYIAPVGKVKQE